MALPDWRPLWLTSVRCLCVLPRIVWRFPGACTDLPPHRLAPWLKLALVALRAADPVCLEWLLFQTRGTAVFELVDGRLLGIPYAWQYCPDQPKHQPRLVVLLLWAQAMHILGGAGPAMLLTGSPNEHTLMLRKVQFVRGFMEWQCSKRYATCCLAERMLSLS